MRLKAKKKQARREKSQNRKGKERKQIEPKADYSVLKADHFVNGAHDSILYPIDGIISIVMAVDKRK